jgi:predicted metalloprotease with PDZ domain
MTMRASLFLSILLLASSVTLSRAQESAMADTIAYALSWDNPVSQLYTVRTTARASGQPVVFSLPAWRPGRYILQNYAANVQNVRAEDESGVSLPVEWVDLDSWRVDPGSAEQVTLIYEYYATTFDGGASVLRPDLAYFNPVNLLPWVEERTGHAAKLTLAAPGDWAVATQLEPVSGDGHVFTAPDYHALVDAPTIASPDLVDWPFEVDGVRFHAVFRPAPDLNDRTRDEVLGALTAIAREEAAIFGGGFPFDEYWHLYQLVPYPFGHAVEHAASASYVIQDQIFASRDAYLGFLSVTSHELFHAWNVKRIRPAALWPYDYSEPQLTRLHWWTEGVTAYYEELVLARAGLTTQNESFETFGRQIQALQNAPGRKVTSASLSSWTSWFSGYGGGNPNQTISFYNKGLLLGLLLDLTIRDATDGAKGLDDVFRLLWEEYYLERRGVPEDGVERAVEAVAERPFDDFFARYVDGTEELPYAETLAVVGLEARQVEVEGKPAATMGLVLQQSGAAITVGNALPGGPALEAGIMRGDIVLAVDGRELESPDLDPILAAHAPGDHIPVRVLRGNQEIVVGVELAGGGNLSGGNLRWEVRPVESPTERQLSLREGWLASRARR